MRVLFDTNIVLDVLLAEFLGTWRPARYFELVAKAN